MSTLYQIDDQIQQVISRGFAVDEETGELLATFDDLDALEVQYSDKMVACGLWIKNQEALAQAIREEEKKLAARRRVIETSVSRMKGYVMAHMDGKFVSPQVSLSKAKSSKVVITDPEQVPDEYKVVETVVREDKRAIGKALRSGSDVPGACLETSMNLQVK